jgi:hypothetical protein
MQAYDTGAGAKRFEREPPVCGKQPLHAADPRPIAACTPLLVIEKNYM